MIKNLWNIIKFYCINGHEAPVLLDVQYGDSPFYACPRYFEIDNDHPYGHLHGERACANRISFRDAEKEVNELSKRIESDMGDSIADYTGMRFSCGHITARVLEYSDSGISIGIINRMAVAKT